MDAMLDRLRDAQADGESGYAGALYLNPARARVSPREFADYDAHIAALSRRLRMTAAHGRTWKPHQWLALLFTERYLDRYFGDAEALCAALDEAREADPLARRMPPYAVAALGTVAFQSATGSGKTLLMHAHILQYRYYLARAGRRLNNVVLVTPDERMSAQHEREMRESGLHARLFSSEAGADLLAPVEIVDLNKLAERKGVKRVAVTDFGPDNLVLVDEGHLGASGKVWRQRRRELARGGFTFEYSATFNQIAGPRDEDLLHAYGKCLLFDYAYRAFHADGYGKDYDIRNLPGGVDDDNSRIYLLGCLLTFYQQCRLWRDRGAGWVAFRPAKPLWVFLGKTVTGSSRADRETRSDVVRILDFLAWVLAHGGEVRSMLARLLAGHSGLTGSDGDDVFAGRFSHLPPTDDLYTDLCQVLFHGPGQLRTVYPTAGEGELHLRSGDSPPFGVVNVGDSAALHKLLVEHGNSDFEVEREMGFAPLLFPNVDRPDSTVNVVVGARRFIAGWNSWRVSTMGLMHVGVGEGPEIVQMFGRGVRLKGWNMSLKRHRESGAPPPADGAGLAELETLHIFGLRANYMQTFRDLLAAEGIATERETVTLPVTWNFARRLKTIRLKEGCRYDLSSERPVLPEPGQGPVVVLDLYSRLQSVSSGGVTAGPGPEKGLGSLKHFAAFFDPVRVHDALLARKRRAGWHNLAIPRRTVAALLVSDDWYELYAPPERLQAACFEDVGKLEEIAIDLLADYANRFWRRHRRRWEGERLEAVPLDENDPNNIGEYRLSVDAKETRLVEDIHKLAEDVQEGYRAGLGLGVLMTANHAWTPLLHASQGCKVTIQPIALNDGERRVVEAITEMAKAGAPCLRGCELFLIRNLARGRGVSFFDDFAYYPDFIAFLVQGEHQHIVFFDPKGLVRYGPGERDKVKLHRNIKSIEEKLRTADPHLGLHAYVLSVTPPGKIGDVPRPRCEWERQGVYFLDDPCWLRKVVEKVLASPTVAV